MTARRTRSPDSLYRNATSSTSALLNSVLLNRAFHNDGLLKAIEAGDFKTKPAVTGGWSRPQFPNDLKPNGERARQKRVYDRASSNRRKRMMGGDGKLPNTIRPWFTEGERAVLSVIAGEVKRLGRCSLPIERIAAMAGVSVRLVQYALATASGKARRKGEDKPACPILLKIEYRPLAGARNSTNVITIVSREWELWLAYRPVEVEGIGCKEVHSTKSPRQQPLSSKRHTGSAIAAERPKEGLGGRERAGPAALGRPRVTLAS